MSKKYTIKLKEIAGRLPVVRAVYKNLLSLYSNVFGRVQAIRELSCLIKANELVLLRPYYQMEGTTAVLREIVRDVVSDFLNVYGTVRLTRKTTTDIAAPAGAVVLLYPLALLRIPSTHAAYLQLVGAKTRNMIRKAERNGYEYKEFDWNNHLNEIYEINTSKETRQSEIMRGWYRKPVKPRNYDSAEHCYRKYYGAFKDGKLCAYSHLVICGDFAFFRHFLGHAQHLRNGIMNGLISWTVQQYIGHPQVQWLKYGTISRISHPMYSFRKHAGFRGYATFLDLEADGELLELARKVRVGYWKGI